MRDVKPPVNLHKLEIDSIDASISRRHHYGQSHAFNKAVPALIIISTLLVFVAGGLIFYLYLLQNNPAGQLSTSSGNQALLTNGLTAQSLITKTKAAVSGDVKQTINDVSGNTYTVFSAPSFRPTGYNFSVRPKNEYGFSLYGTKDTITSDRITTQKGLVDAGLTETILNPGSDTIAFAASYQSGTITCQLNDQKPYRKTTAALDYGVTLGCADISDYLTNAATLRPYFIVYASQARTDTTKILMSSLTSTASKTTGYSLATVSMSGSDYGSVGGFAALFYVTPDMSLHYFTSTHSELLCRQYSSAELRKAYLGEQCYDETAGNQQASVQL